jgi:hypothetical protein
MSYLVFGLGLLLAVCGAASISFGYGIVNVERGWASVIGGAAALSGGIVTIALAAILHSLSGLRAFLKAGRGADAPPQSEQRVISVTPEQAVAVIPRSVSDEPSAEDAGGAGAAFNATRAVVDDAGSAAAAGRRPEPSAAPVAPATIEGIRRLVADTIDSRTDRSAEIAAPAPAADLDSAAPEALAQRPPVERVTRRRPDLAPFGLPRALDLKDLPTRRSIAAPAEVSASRGPSPPAPAPARPSPPPARPVKDDQRSPPRGDSDGVKVIGRYESEGTTYVMFADGSIDASSGRGAFHFSSMAELKVFMDAQARGES